LRFRGQQEDGRNELGVVARDPGNPGERISLEHNEQNIGGNAGQHPEKRWKYLRYWTGDVKSFMTSMPTRTDEQSAKTPP
jgi:hypothetical protein